MSLSREGFWKVGFWSETFWTENFWYEPTTTSINITIIIDKSIITNVTSYNTRTDIVDNTQDIIVNISKDQKIFRQV